MYHSLLFWDGKSFYTASEALALGDLSLAGTAKGTDTWRDWHLIPTAKPSIVDPPLASNFLNNDGRAGSIDMSEGYVGKPVYGDRVGSLNFYVMNDYENWTEIRRKIAQALNGKQVKMILEDDPEYYFEGKFTLQAWASDPNFSQVTLNYQLKPYRKHVTNSSRYGQIYWDPFNFEEDYDYTVDPTFDLGSYVNILEEEVL